MNVVQTSFIVLQLMASSPLFHTQHLLKKKLHLCNTSKTQKSFRSVYAINLHTAAITFCDPGNKKVFLTQLNL